MNKKIIGWAAILTVFFVLVLFWGMKHVGNMSENELKQIVQRDTLVFRTDELRAEVLKKLAENNVVVMGEYHNIAEHNTFMYQISTMLNQDYGFSDFLLEAPQAFSWIFEDYSAGVMPEADEQTAKTFCFYIGELKKIRQYNLTLPEEKRLTVRTIDINHSPYSYLMSMQHMLNFVQDRFVLEKEFNIFKSVIQEDSKYIQAVQDFRDNLAENPEEFRDKLGAIWYERLVEMTEAELLSYECRKASNFIFSWKRDKRREGIMGQFVDNHIKEAKGKVLINAGGNHAQKKSVRGTKMQWLGEYLQYESQQAKGQTYCMIIVPAQGTIEKSGTNGKPVNLVAGPYRNELFRKITEYANGSGAFLSFDDQKFLKEKALMNFHYDIQSLPPKEIYDGVIILLKGTYVNPFPAET